MPASMPRSSRIRRCSSDCGFQPSVAATTNTHADTPPTPGEHVAQELHVAGHVDEAEFGTGRQRRVRETEVDGEPASLLLLEPVGIGAGEREHQRRLAVVDVAGGGDDGHDAGIDTRREERSDDDGVVVVGSTERRSSIVRSSRDRAITGGSWRRSAASRSPSISTPNDGIVMPGAEPGARQRLHRRSRRPTGARRTRRRDRLGAPAQHGDRRGNHRPERDVGDRALVEVGQARSPAARRAPGRPVATPGPADDAGSARPDRRGRR
jgi:hypothetical protein